MLGPASLCRLACALGALFLRHLGGACLATLETTTAAKLDRDRVFAVLVECTGALRHKPKADGRLYASLDHKVKRGALSVTAHACARTARACRAVRDLLAD